MSETYSTDKIVDFLERCNYAMYSDYYVAAIIKLREADEYAPLIEAMGRIDKAELHDFIHLYLADLDPNPILEFMETVYMALPEKGKL